MSTIDTLRPTAYAIRQGILDSPALSIDGNETTFAELLDSNGVVPCIVDFGAWAGSTIYEPTRSGAVLDLWGQWDSTDLADVVFVSTSLDNGATFQLLAGYGNLTGFAQKTDPDPIKVSQAVFSRLAGHPIANFQVRIEFQNVTPIGEEQLPKLDGGGPL